LSQLKLNQQIQSLILEKDKAGKPYSDADKKLIAQYEGSGGQGSKGATGEGVLYEFYTPDYVCELMWKLAYRYGFKPTGTVLEPAMGNGKMLQFAPDQSKCYRL
jgi:hypothetical protein